MMMRVEDSNARVRAEYLRNAEEPLEQKVERNRSTVVSIQDVAFVVAYLGVMSATILVHRDARLGRIIILDSG